MQDSKKQSGYTGDRNLDLDSILKDIIKQWWVILLFAVTMALLAGSLVKFRYKPVYETTTTFAVGKTGFSSSVAYDNLNSAKNVTTKFQQVAESNILRKKVCEELKMDSFPGNVSVSVVESSNLMTMTVTADSPKHAYDMIHSVMDHTVELTQELMDSVAVKVLMEPQVPMAPKNPLNAHGPMKKAAVLAAALLMVVFGILSYFKDTVKTPEEAVSKIDAKILGTIWYEKKHLTKEEKKMGKKKALNIENPLLSFAYVESVKLMATKVRIAMERKHAKVLLVTSVSENEGKSTVAANLALALSQEEKDVVLVDCDFRKPSQYKIFEAEQDVVKAADLSMALLGKQKVSIQKVGEDQQLKIIYSVRPHQNILRNNVVDYLQNLIYILREQTDYVVLDTSPMALASDAEVLAELADASILVVQQDMMETKYINDAVDQLNRTKAKVLGCVFNNVHKGILGRTREYGQYYGTYGYGKYGKYSHYDKRGSRKGKQVQE